MKPCCLQISHTDAGSQVPVARRASHHTCCKHVASERLVLYGLVHVWPTELVDDASRRPRQRRIPEFASTTQLRPEEYQERSC